MSAPYWGELPQPKKPRDGRNPDDYTDYSAADQHHSLDYQPPRRTNRASIQTTYTEAPSESTFSPHSPTTSSFLPEGLAPRPPSYQQGWGSDIASDRQDKRNRRPSRQYEEAEEPPSPSGPDASRGPPVSYRQSHTNNTIPYSNPASTSGRPSRRSVSAAEGTQREQDPQYAHNGEMGGYPQYPYDDGAVRRESASNPQGVPAQSRRASAAASSERRKNMTKEEKRARVEAAEHRARQRLATKAGNQSTGEPEPACDRLSPLIQERKAPVRLEPAAPIVPQTSLPRQRQEYEEPPTHTARPPQHISEDPRNYAPAPIPPLEPSADQQQPGPDSGIPKRNLSFRERAARKEMQYPSEEMGPNTKPIPQATSGGFSLTRSGSNKLKKNPPADAWQRAGQDSDRRLPPSSIPIASSAEPFIPKGTGQTKTRRESFSARDKELPPLPSPTNDSLSPPPIGPQHTTGMDAHGMRRRVTEPVHRREFGLDEEYIPPPTRGKIDHPPNHGPSALPSDVATTQTRRQRRYSDDSTDSSHHRTPGVRFLERDVLGPGGGLYQPPQWLDEWKKGTVGALSGTLLDLSYEPTVIPERNNDVNKAWWEQAPAQGQHRRNSSVGNRPRKAEAFDGEYDDNNAPTRFKPPLHLKCGPLLRYCGIRREKIPTRSQEGAVSEREIWRGSIMIVTNDADSSYEIAPTLRLFVQDMELLPPPPHQVKGELSPEYVDPIAGHPKLGRRGETLYVRPVEHLEEAKDLSRDESDEGLFESSRSPPDDPPPNGAADFPGSYASRRKRVDVDGEKMQKYKDVRGFRLHVEQGCTFWRFNIEVELREKQQRIAYRINRGPSLGFWVPGRGNTMNIMFYSCNGFSSSVKPDEFSGPDPMWRDVLNTHQTQPFHVMIGGGDQIYNDCVANETELFSEWLDIKNPIHKRHEPFTAMMQTELEQFYLERYCMWFSQGLYGLANSQIPMVNMLDDHDIFDGYGSYPHHDMISPVFSGLGAVGFKYYMLFQHQSLVTETENFEPSWIVGEQPGPYINEQSRSLYMSMGGKVALLAIDGRTERTEHTVIDERTWEKITNRLYAEVRRGQVEHLLVLVGVPIAYPRLVWLENILTSKFMDPVKALGRMGVFGKVLNNIDGGVEVLDDLNDHWTAKNHKKERTIVMEDLQDLAIDKSLRITLLSGDVHLAAIGQFYSNPKLGLPKHKDPRYMPNLISSAIVNTPPPDLMADVLNRRNKVHHFDKQTDESMIPIFQLGVDGKPRNNKHLLPHRNWCAIRQWTPGRTPPPSPPASSDGRSQTPPPSGVGGLLRRLSSRKKPPPTRLDASRESVRGPRPPISGGGSGLFRSFSRSRRNSTDGQQRPGFLKRTLSLGRGDAPKPDFDNDRFDRPASQSQHTDGGVNSQWGHRNEEDMYMDHRPSANHPQMRLRGGAAYDEFSDGDESQFTALPTRRAQTFGNQSTAVARQEMEEPPIRPFHRTPTGLSVKQMRQADKHQIDLEGGLDISLNVEVNPKDPTGITVPYRILVPKLFYEYTPEDDELPEAQPSGFKRLLSVRKKRQQDASQVEATGQEEQYDSDEDDEFQRR